MGFFRITGDTGVVHLKEVGKEAHVPRDMVYRVAHLAQGISLSDLVVLQHLSCT